MNRKEIIISVPTEKIVDSDWDMESFQLGEHLHKLINVYGLDVVKTELSECEWFLNTIKNK